MINDDLGKLTFAAHLFTLRKGKNLTQLELAQQLQITQESICHCESGKDWPSYPTLLKLAQAFGVTTDYLLGLSEHKEPPSEFGEVRDSQEQKLINDFRLLRPSAKQLVVGYVQGAKEAQNA